MDRYPHLCRRCGTPIPRTGWLSETHRICAICAAAARAACPPFFCTTADIDAGYEGYDDEIA
ncbi:MAG: hypothetical protein ABW167_19595 [Baekduia sp.]